MLSAIHVLNNTLHMEAASVVCNLGAFSPITDIRFLDTIPHTAVVVVRMWTGPRTNGKQLIDNTANADTAIHSVRLQGCDSIIDPALVLSVGEDPA